MPIKRDTPTDAYVYCSMLLKFGMVIYIIRRDEIQPRKMSHVII